jgi:hypothetical protein
MFSPLHRSDKLSRYIEFTDAADIVLLAGDVVALAVIAFVILSSPVRYFIRKRRCCVNVSCCGKKEVVEQEEVVRRVESVLKCVSLRPPRHFRPRHFRML